MPLSGTFRQHSLPEVLRLIESGRQAGVLVVTDGTRQAAIYLDGGQWLLSDRIGSPLSLLHRLLRAGLIAEPQVEAVMGMPFAQAAQLSEVQVVRALVQSGALAQDQVRRFVQDDAAALLALMCGWADGEFAFEEAVQVPPGRLAIPLPVGVLVAQALSGDRVSAPPSAPPPLHRDAILAFVEPAPGVTGTVRVTRYQWALLAHVDGRTPLWAIAEKLQQPEHVVAGVANELVQTGVLELAPQLTPSA
jgi:hypothetical protein